MHDQGDGSTPERADGGEPDRRQRERGLADAVGVGLYRLDAEGRFVAVNDFVVEQTGYAREGLVGSHVSTLLDADDVSRLDREIRRRLEAGEETGGRLNLVVEAADGERIPSELEFGLLVDDGEFEGTAGVVRPLETRSDREPDQLPSIWGMEESIASVIDEADVGVFVLDDQFDVVWIDETVEEYFGIDRREVVGRDKRTLIEERICDRFEDPERFAETVTATYDDNTYVERFECRITAGDGREARWLEHRSRPIESGRYAGGRIELYYDVTDRKAAERALRESEQWFRSLVEAVDEYAIYMLDTDGCVDSWTAGAERIKGYAEDEIRGDHFSRFYTEEDREAGVPSENLARARAERSIETEGWRVRADGSRFWANVTITAIRNDGELQGYAKITRDMTDRREREQQLRREHELITRILEASPVGIAVVRPDGSTSRANERMAELLGLPADEAGSYTAGQREMFDADGELLPVDERPAGRVFETGEPVFDREILVDPPEGSRRWLSINATPVAVEVDEPDRVVATATDITELKELASKRKRDLEEREKELGAIGLATRLLETADRPVAELLSEFVTSLPEFFQQPAKTAARVSVGDVDVATESYEPTERSIVATGRTSGETPLRIEVVRLDEQPDESVAFLDEEQELIETLAKLLSVHFDRHEYVEELRTSNERLEQFAYAASHDLQEPLRMVSSYLQLIDRRYGDTLDDDGEEFLAYAVDGAERMREMIDGLLAYSRVETRGGAFDRIDLDAVLADVREDLRLRIDEHDAEITSESLPTVAGDASQLRQLFQNLLENAIEYSGDDPPCVTVSAERVEERWQLSVRDEGIGIETDDHERIFEVFQRLHSREEHDGAGIGLALCERIVERHGGEIRVDSAPGEGTTVIFTLPDASRVVDDETDSDRPR